jgi:hypothetical protein
MRKSVQVLMLASCVVMSFNAPAVFARDKTKSAIDVDADVTLGGKKSLGADVSASIDGRKGVNGHVGANLGGLKGLNAEVDANVGGHEDIDAKVDVSLGGNQGVDANIDATIGGNNSVNVGVDVGTSIDDGTLNTRPDMTDREPKPDDQDGLTSSQRQAFNDMSASERKALIKRCNSVGTDGYDPALVNLCRLLRLSASR